jgi:gliding motility-associated-like protein
MTKYLLNNTRNTIRNSSIGLNNRHRFFKSIILSIFIFVGIIGSVWGQVALIPTSDGGFENATSAFSNNGWTAVGTSARTWRVGAFGGFATGTKAAYWGTTTAYGGSAASAVGHFYRDIAIPAGATNVFLNYKLKYPIVDNTYDYFYVFTTTTSNTPVNGTIPTTGYTTRFINSATTYAAFTAMPQVNLTALAGTTIRLVFTFKSDAWSPHSAPAVDDITLTYISGASCSGTPNAGTSAINAASGCSGSPFTLSASGISSGSGITYQWQSGPSAAGPWSNITGATNATLTTSTTTTTFYKLVTTCTLSSLANSSNAVSYTVVGCCTNTLQCYDSYGDGWNGGSVNLIVGGALYGNYTIGSGYGPTTVNFNTFSGQTIQVVLAAGGAYPTEMYFNVLNGAGTPMVSNWYPNSSGTWNGTANCPLPPTISSISPATACGTGVSVVITGTNFTGATAVQINGVAVTSYVVNSNTQITAITSPSNTSGLVTVVNTVGTATSASSISIYPLPIITTQPGTPVAFCGGAGTSTLSVTATGGVSYQWQKNGVNISGAPYSNFTTSTLTITNPSTAENGASITCIITGAGGCTVTSLAQILSVGSSPLLPAPVTATNSTICQGQSSLLNAISIGNYINWYDAPTGGTLLTTLPSGTNYSVSPGANTTYYAEAVSINIGTPTTQTFSYTGGAQTWTVPAGVTSISVDMSGAKGGNQSAYGGAGGSGGRLQSTYPVTPGQVLNLFVGGASTSTIGGYNGGGSGPTASTTYGGGGGGASDIRIGGTALANRILVAGGGGGAGTDCFSNTNPGGAGGGLVGAHGWDCNTQGTTYVGKGGTQSAGGATGTLSPGTAGSLGTGGNGSATYGGGGGGGYFGGGGGAYGGGGGGSSFSDLNASSVTHTQGYMAGNGQILISYTPIIAGCTSTSRQDVTVTVNPAPTASAGPALSGICAGGTSAAMGGSVGGSATGGTWSGGAGTWTDASNPATATYTAGSSESGTITLTLSTSGGGCTAVTVTKSIVINALPIISAGPDATLCPSQTVVLAGTSNVADSYVYTLNMLDSWGDGWDGAYLTAFINGSSIGTYSASGSGSTATINVSAGQTISFAYTSAAFENEHSYSISLNGTVVYSTGAYPPTGTIYTNNNHPQTVTYSWSPSTGLSSSTVLAPTCSASTTTTYALTVTRNGCAVTDNVLITVIPGAVAGTLSGSQSTCIGSTSSFTTNGAAGGTWSSSNTSIATVDISTGVITGIAVGTSTITYTVAGVSGCPNATATRLINVYAYPAINAGTDATICPSSSIGLTGTSNMADSYVYTLNMNDAYGDGWNGGYLTAFVNGASIGTYSATGYGSSATINVSAGQTIYFTYSPGSWEYENSYSISLNGAAVYSTGTNPPTGTIYTNNSHPQTITYAWSPGTGLSSTSILSPTYTATTSTVATYTLTVTANGCASTDQVTITVQDLLPPTLTCPSNITLNSATGTCGQTATFTTPLATDDCSPNVLSANLLVNGNGTAGLTGWNVTQNGGNGWANSGENALGVGTSFIGSYAWCVKNQVVDLISNGFTSTQLDLSPQIAVGEYYKANVCCSATDQYFYTAELLNAALVPIATYNLGSIGSPVNSTAIWQQINYSFTGYPTGVRYVRITHGSKDNEFWGGQYGTVISESSVKIYTPGTITAIQTAGLASGSIFPVGTTTNTFTATDPTGNATSCSFTVTVVDNELPIANCQNITVPLDNSGLISITAAQINNNSTDNCGIAAITATPTSFNCSNLGQNTVVMTVIDVNGNISTCNSIVTIVDTQAPVANCQNVTFQLDALGTYTATGAMVNNGSIDNCSISSYTLNQSIFTCADIGTNPYTLTVTDGSGNTNTCTSMITIQDVVAPTAICQNITAQLDVLGLVSITAGQVNNGSNDACGIATTTINNSNFNCSNLGANTVTLTVTDLYNNVSTCTSTVTIADTVSPLFISTPANITNTAVTNICGRVIYYNAPTFGDNCTATMSQIDNSGLTSGDIFPVGVTTQTYEIVDQSGNNTLYSFTITIVDNQNPIITNCPANISVSTSQNSCNAVVNWTAPAISDNCPGVQYTVSNASGSTFTAGSTTVTYTATDVSNNTSTCSFTVTVTDNIAPVVPTLATVTGSCSVTVTPPTTTDNCSGVITGTASTPLSYSIPGTNVITWTFTDIAGNSSTANQTVIVQDNVFPTITAPAAISTTTNTACSATGVVLGTPVTADDCAVISVTNNAPATFNLGTTTVTWTVTDASGNATNATQLVTVIDNVNPTITAPAAVNVNANNACSAFSVALGTPVTSDNCSVASVTHNAPATFAIGATTVTWTVTDGSGLTATATQTVTVVDATNPTIVAPANITANSNAACSVTGLNLGTPVAADNCSVASVSNNAPVIFNTGITTVTWTVTDASGNTATATQTVTVIDNTFPTITAPAAISTTTNTACTATGVVLGTPVTADNCSVASVTNNAPATFNLGTTTVTWTVTDASGNATNATQLVTVIDNVNPTITAPAAVNVNANNACSAFSVALGTPVTSDNCSVASVTHNAPATFAIGATTVTWTVTDGSGLTATATQTVTVVDATNPTIVAPANITANSNAACSVTGLNLGTPVAADNCSVASVSNNAPVIFNTGITTVTWTVTDASGNTATATQTVTVIDNTFPTITAPAAISTTTNTACSATGVVLGTPVTADDCAVVSVTNNAPATFNLGTTTVTWTVTDASGNATNATQIVTVIDNVNPTITAPTAVNATTNNGCMALNVALGTPVTADNCSIASVTHNAPNAFNVGITVVTWTITDGSGNTATANQNVTITDVIAPIVIAPQNINSSSNTSCTATGLNIGTAIALDNCTVASITSNAPAAFPVGTTIVTWSATDNSGNIGTATQTVTIIDNIYPSIIPPNDLTAVTNSGCTADNLNLGTPITSDNCGVAFVTNNAPSAFAVGETFVTWTVIDVNGNATNTIQKVTITDDVAPILIPAANITVFANNSCNAFNVNLGNPVVSDNCGIASLVNDGPTVYDLGTTTVNWTVTDNNGNVVSASQTVTVIDNQIPTIIPPASLMLSTNNACVASNVIIGNAITNDNCTVASVINDAPVDFPVGTTVVTWTVTDASGNTNTGTQTITVTDDINPTIVLQNITVTLDLQGNAVVGFNDVDAGSFDNCGIATTSLSQTNFDCGNIGQNVLTVTITDNNGNTSVANITLTIETNGIDSDLDGIDDSCDDVADPIELLIPEAFTPNGNNINDLFVIRNIETLNTKNLEVFNRYGNRVYSSSNYQNDWDGSRSDNGQALPDGTYYYVFIADSDTFKGYVYINRVKQ